MNSKPSFKKKLIATAIGSYALAGLSGMAIAQTNQPVMEEVIVTGIMGSLTRAMDIKRDSQGVVDAIAAEDIGKFPDTNLAESLQRITGVSISRANNEGSQITVRGFGPDFNLVTLNGRQMPSTGFNRSFEFSDLAAEGISGVDVYKTFSADKVSGGIGSVVNIKTARPLDNPGLNGTVVAKAAMDTTNETGDDVTPDISAIVSSTFADDTIGVLISGSFQARDSRAVNADIASWRNNHVSDMSNVEDNRADPEGNTYYPRNFGYGIDDISRERTNAQVVFQYAPTDNITATLDYTYSHVDYRALNTGVGIWFDDTPAAMTGAVIDENGTFVRVTETGNDYASNIRLNTSETESQSLGFNLEWDVSDNLDVRFDVHHSDRVNEGVGRGNDAFLILAANHIDNKTYDATPGNDIPDMYITFNPDGWGIEDGLPTAASYDSLFGQAGTNINKSEVTQVQIDSTWNTLAERGLVSIDFGVANTEISNRWRSYNTGQIAAGWYGGNNGENEDWDWLAGEGFAGGPDLFPNDMFSEHSLTGLMPSFSGAGGNVPIYHTWDFERGVAAAEAEWAIPGGSDRPWGWDQAPNGMWPDTDGNPIVDNRVEEKTRSAYIQFNNEGELAGMPLAISTGLRYERTEVTSTSFQQDPVAIRWVAPTEFATTLSEESTYTSRGADYALWLPSLDATLEIADDVVGRFSYSQSVTRPSLGNMTATRQVTDRPSSGARTGSQGNPGLRPFTSDNLDLSLEWYYAPGSYVSVGLFHKQVEDFIVNEFVEMDVFGLRDPTAGPRAEQARQDLADAGVTDITDQDLFAQMNANQGTSASAIVQQDDDPLAPFQMSTPRNLENAKLQGIEMAVQHAFGDTGFGVIANMTLVGGDLKVDNASTDFQFVLPGLSDSANLIAFYDKDGLQARIAYNWRDTFLNGVGENNTPYYTEAYGQVDLSVSYDLPFVEGLTIFAEGINVTDESQRVYARYKNQFKSAHQYGARYNLGVRYSF